MGHVLSLLGLVQAVRTAVGPVGPTVWLDGVVRAVAGWRALLARLDDGAGGRTKAVVRAVHRTASEEAATGCPELGSSRFCSPTNPADEVAERSGRGWWR
ncbi:hypothetical protein Droror1_Dr00026000 [Drosera rotundifolia]